MRRGRKAYIRLSADISAQELRRKAQSSEQENASRFEALARVAEGDDYRTIAKAYNVSRSTIYYWINRFNEYGLGAFDKPFRRGRHSIHKLPLNLTPDMIETVAPKECDRRVSRRFLAISMLLDNERPCDVARQLGVSSSTITSWIKRAYQDGILSLTQLRRGSARTSQRMRRDVAPSRLRYAATIAKRRNQLRAARRLTAVACVLDGMKLTDVAGEMGISCSTVSKWSQAFNKDGIDGLFSRLDQKIAAKR